MLNERKEPFYRVYLDKWNGCVIRAKPSQKLKKEFDARKNR